MPGERTDAFRAEQALILLTACTASHRTAMRECIEAQLAAVSWERLRGLLQAQRLLPTLGPRIVALAGHRASAGFASSVAASVEEARRQEALLTLIAERTMGALSVAGIRSAGLKGPALGEAIYGEPGRRLSSDIDLLVAAEQLDAAVEVVRGLGYAPPADYVGARGLPLLHFSLAHESGELPPIELHWRIHWYETRFASERLLAPGGAPGSWRPSPADELAALLLYYARDGFTALRQAADLAAWWDAFGSDLDEREMAELARGYPALAPAFSTALAVAERTVRLPGRHVAGGARLGPRGRVAVRLADVRPHGSRAQLFAEISLIDGLLTPPKGLPAFVRRQVAPPVEVIREHVEKAQRGRVTSTLGYSLRVLGRYALALARLARPQARVDDAVA